MFSARLVPSCSPGTCGRLLGRDCTRCKYRLALLMANRQLAKSIAGTILVDQQIIQASRTVRFDPRICLKNEDVQLSIVLPESTHSFRSYLSISASFDVLKHVQAIKPIIERSL